MGWSGYFALDDVEIINASRTETLAADQPWFRAVYKNAALRYLLNETFSDVTDAPWYDPDVPQSADFFGAYPLGVSGIEDSTATSTVVESTLDGGNVGRLRHATRSVVFSLALIGASEAAVEYGIRWLKRALINPCGPSTPGCTGAILTYLSSPPTFSTSPPEPVVVDAILDGGTASESVDFPVLSGGDADFTGDHGFDGGDAFGTGTTLSPPLPEPFEEPPLPPFDEIGSLAEYLRHLYRFQINSGPAVTAKKEIAACNAVVWTVTMTGVAGDPAEYGPPVPLVLGFGDPDVADPIVPGTGGTYNDVGFSQVEVPCAQPIYDPIYDPACPAVVVPPPPPDIALGCFEVPTTWWRRTITINEDQIPYWGEMVPVITLRLAEEEGGVDAVRLRFYRDRDNSGTIPDQCDFVTDMVVTYLPPDGNLVIDGVNQAVYLLDTNTGIRRRADSLVVTTEGKPFDWEGLACGYGYILTVDTLTGEAAPILDLSLVAKVD